MIPALGEKEGAAESTDSSRKLEIEHHDEKQHEAIAS